MLIKFLSNDEVVLLSWDRDMANSGLRLGFFGEETALPIAAARIAMRTGSAFVPAFNLCRGDGRYDVYFEPGIDIIKEGNGANAKNVEQIAHVVEKYIKSCPNQWVVLTPIGAKG